MCYGCRVHEVCIACIFYYVVLPGVLVTLGCYANTIRGGRVCTGVIRRARNWKLGVIVLSTAVALGTVVKRL